MRLRLPTIAACVMAVLVLVSPPARAWLESSMTAQMLVQLPLLAAVGAWMASALPASAGKWFARRDRWGINGLLLASMTSLVWMLPRALDAAVDDAWIAGAKFATVPLLIGMPLALSWRRASLVLRGVFLAETIATCFRLGWLYQVSPQRLCSNYLLNDQQRLGYWLLVIGAALFVLLMGKLLAGRFEPGPDAQMQGGER